MKLKGNVYVAMILSLLLVMALYSMSRIAFYLFNNSFFPDMTLPRFLTIMWGGLRFDRTAVLYTNALFIIMMILPFNFRFTKAYRHILKWIFIITNGIALAFNTSDFVYYPYTLRRTTASVFSQLENEGNLGSLFFRYIFEYWYATLFYIFLMFLLVKGFNRIKIEGPQIKNKILYYATGLLVIPAVIGLFIAGVRGGFLHSTRPITLSNAGAFVSAPRDMNIVLNTPFAIIRTLRHNLVEKVNYYSSEAELEKIYTPLHLPDNSVQMKRKNVVVIILESFGREYIGTYNKDLENGTYKGYAPFIDSLLLHSKSYYYAYANGRKSIDVLPSVITSIPSIEVPYVLSNYSSNDVNSIGSLLGKKGYHTSFFHGANNSSMGFNAFVNVAGYKHHFGKNEYEQEHGTDDFDGIWGIWDEEFFDFYADKLNTFPQPFHSVIFSATSHSPYKIPEHYGNVFKGGPLKIHRTIQYTDHALQKFFNKVSLMPWYENTLFVITADHCSALIQYDEYRTAAGYFAIPLIFFEPGSDLKGMSYDLAQQTDIMPAVMDYLGFDESYIAFGNELFDENKGKFVFNYLDNIYQFFEGDYMMMFDGTKSIALYKFKTDKLLSQNLLEEFPDTVNAMVKKVKAVIQQYNNRMADNRLTLK